MSTGYDTVIFDLDGTLLDTLDDLTAAVNYALETYHQPLRTREEVRKFVGNGLYKLMERAVKGGEANPCFTQIYETQRRYYGEHCNDSTRPYPGVMELLEELKQDGYKLAIVSNKADFAVKQLRDIYFDEVIETAIGEREGIRRKPAPDTVLQALRELDSDCSRAVYIGDSEVDIWTAANADMDCISVTWGFRDEAFLKEQGAVILADDTRKIKKLFCYTPSNRPEAPQGSTSPFEDTGSPTSSAVILPEKRFNSVPSK